MLVSIDLRAGSPWQIDRLFGRRSAPAARGSICVIICTCNAFGKALGELKSDAVARRLSSRAQTASAAAGVQRAGEVGAVREACVGPAFKANGLGCSVGIRSRPPWPWRGNTAPLTSTPSFGQQRTIFVQMAKVSMSVCDAEMRCEVRTWIRSATRRNLNALPRANTPSRSRLDGVSKTCRHHEKSSFCLTKTG